MFINRDPAGVQSLDKSCCPQFLAPKNKHTWQKFYSSLLENPSVHFVFVFQNLFSDLLKIHGGGYWNYPKGIIYLIIAHQDLQMSPVIFRFNQFGFHRSNLPWLNVQLQLIFSSPLSQAACQYCLLQIPTYIPRVIILTCLLLLHEAMRPQFISTLLPQSSQAVIWVLLADLKPNKVLFVGCVCVLLGHLDPRDVSGLILGYTVLCNPLYAQIFLVALNLWKKSTSQWTPLHLCLRKELDKLTFETSSSLHVILRDK